MEPQEILEAISEPEWGELSDGYSGLTGERVVSATKLAAFLSKHLPKEE